MMKDIGEPSKGGVVRVPLSIAGEIRQMLWQRPVRSKQSNKIDKDSNETADLGHRFQRRRCESQGGFLAEPEKVLIQPGGSSHSRAIPKFGLQRSNGSKEVERKRLSNHRID